MDEDLNMRQESIKILEENIGSNLFNLVHNNFLLDTSPKARETKAKMNKWENTQLKSFLHSKGNHQQDKKAIY